MANYISDFFENRGWLGLVQQNATTGELESGGAVITVPVYDWGVGCPLPSDLAAGSVIGVSPASFGGSGKSTFPIYLRSDGNIYMPACRQLLARQNGTKAAPVSAVASNIVASTVCRFSQGTSYSMPANFLAVGWNVTVKATGFRGTTVAGTAALKAMITDSDAMSGGSSILIAQNTITTTASAAWSIDATGPIGPGGVLVRNDATAKIGLQNGASGDGTLTLGSVNYILVGVTAATNSDDFALVNYSFYIE